MTDGLVVVASAHGFAQTLDKLAAALTVAGVQIFARIDHAANAREAGLSLRPTTLLIFGSAKAGTPLMQANQTLGLDLPLRALVYEDTVGKAWIAYNEPDWIAERQGLQPAAFLTVSAMAKLIATVVAQAGA
jgi:uncharacterized protein (DUF302 family)